MSIREDYKNKFAREHAEQSVHPYEFWYGIAELLFENRANQKVDLFTPLGNWLNNWTVFGFLSGINGRAMAIDKEQGMENAFALYEICVAENFSGSHPYDRLRIWYTKSKQYKDAIRVCNVYINLPERKHGLDKDRFQHHIEQLNKKLDKENRRA